VVTLPESLFESELSHGWCYYFEKADLARQFGDWKEVVELGDIGFRLENDAPNDPIERFVFIEGYANMGEWERAIELSRISYRVSRDYVGPLLCRLWERIETETTESMQRGETLSEIKNMFSCDP
jgi:hypothetical protein